MPNVSTMHKNADLLSPEGTGKNAGFSNWQKAAHGIGNRALSGFIESMDPGDQPGNKNAHTAIAERLQKLGLPIQTYISVPAGEFLQDPEFHLSKIPHGDYYFASIRPGLHLAHADSSERVIEFVQDFVWANSDKEKAAKDVYISHNGEPTMSGHIMIEKGAEPNAIQGEFTIGNFNLFHRGVRTPEITVQRDGRRFSWSFRGVLSTQEDWHNEDAEFTCNGGAKMSRPEMARRIFAAINKIPHDGNMYLPGYYEVLLENVGGNRTRPAYIEAVLK